MGKKGARNGEETVVSVSSNAVKSEDGEESEGVSGDGTEALGERL